MAIKIKRAAGSVLFVALALFLLAKTSFLFERKYSYSKYYDFYGQEEDFEVLFLGTSHVMNAVYPMELWRDYGIVSYNLANNSENICTNYWQLVNALEHTTPKVVVIDLYAVDGDSKVNIKYLHNFTDAMPLSPTKIRMVWDLLEPADRAEYLFPFSLYHSRWDDDFGREDLHPEAGWQKGAELREEVVVNTPPQLIPKEQYDPAERLNKQYLQKIIDLCGEKGIDIVLMYIPYTMPAGEMAVANWGYVAAEQNGIPYLNFVYEDLTLDYATDCADEGHHLNASGAKKVSDFLGKFLTENYDVHDNRENPAYAFWHQDYEEYRQNKLDWLNRQQETWSYLMLLNDADYETKVYATKDSLIYQDDEIMALLNNIGVFGALTYVELSDEYYEGNFMVEVTDKRTGEVVSERWFTRIEANVYDTY